MEQTGKQLEEQWKSIDWKNVERFVKKTSRTDLSRYREKRLQE
jgi:hypothetical protein